jgi:hypothetical protein
MPFVDITPRQQAISREKSREWRDLISGGLQEGYDEGVKATRRQKALQEQRDYEEQRELDRQTYATNVEASRRKFEEGQLRKKLKADKEIAGVKSAAAKKKETSDRTKNLQDMTSNLRKEVQGTEAAKRLDMVSSSIGKLKSALERSSPAGDLAAVFSFMKLNDPRSVVRESEFKSAEQARAALTKLEASGTTVPAKLIQMVQALEGKGRLLPAQRKDFLNTAIDFVEADITAYQRATEPQMRAAESYGLPQEQIFSPIPDVAKLRNYNIPSKAEEAARALADLPPGLRPTNIGGQDSGVLMGTAQANPMGPINYKQQAEAMSPEERAGLLDRVNRNENELQMLLNKARQR